MVAMLPGAVATMLATVGIRTTTGPVAPLARFLAPAARPLLLVATLLVVVALLRCGLAPASLAATGGVLLYLSMYVLPTGGGAMTAMGAPAAHLSAVAARAGAPGMTNAPSFYVGLGTFLTSYLWSGVRRHRHTCKPVALATVH
jgi:hypothetical protein